PTFGQLEFGSEECWALRRGLPHVGGASENEPNCAHVGAFVGDSICLPMMAQSNSLGVVHLRRERDSPSAASDEFRSHATRNLAAAFTEQVALALANFQLRD